MTLWTVSKWCFLHIYKRKGETQKTKDVRCETTQENNYLWNFEFIYGGHIIIPITMCTCMNFYTKIMVFKKKDVCIGKYSVLGSEREVGDFLCIGLKNLFMGICDWLLFGFCSVFDPSVGKLLHWPRKVKESTHQMF